MPSERIQRVIDGYLDEIEVATKDGRWNDVSELTQKVLELDDSNEDAKAFAKLAGDSGAEMGQTTEYEGSESSETSDAPDSLGGWLILVGLGLLFNTWIFITNAANSFNTKLYPGRTTPDEELFYTIDGFSCLIFAGANVILAFLYFMKKQSFPNVYVGVLCTATAWSFLNWLWAANVLNPNLNDVSYYLIHTILMLVTSAAWIPYMRKSKQVKATFTR